MNAIGTNCIYGITESWLGETDFDLPVNPYNNSFHCSRKERGIGRGVLLLIPRSSTVN